MSVQLHNITKIFGKQTAVDNLSFSAQPSEILGFLGPNGAGKTTTMKMITGFFQPNSGSIEVCGENIISQPIQTKKFIGYLPENNPLYKDMYVREYLLTFAHLYKIPNPQSRVEELIQLTGLTREQNKIIGTLSKGYRQRVGLSQALIHDPKVLILDEPTSGLDPNQILEIRELIRNIGKEKTIIFSTHIMQEVKMLCDRVIIINNGKLIVDDTIDELQGRLQNRQCVQVEFRNDPGIQAVKKIPQVDSVKTINSGHYALYSYGSEDLRDIVFDYCVQNNYPIRELIKDKSSVEEVFTLLTKSTNS